jgi:tRNA(fMet)-specific endonuclease VapC
VVGYPRVGAPRTGAREAAYSRLQRGLEFYRRWICLPFDSAASTVFDRLRSEKLRLGTNDLAIAAIALSTGATLVTRNVVDFQRIPTLLFEDWGN